MGDLSYNKRAARARVKAQFGAHKKRSGLDGFSVHGRHVVSKISGPYARVRWAVEVVRIWTAARRDGVPASQIQYPKPPGEAKMRPQS